MSPPDNSRTPPPPRIDNLQLHAGFPRLLPPMVAQILDVIPQLRRFERLLAVEQARRQAAQLVRLMAHARTYSPFWRNRLPSPTSATPVDPSSLIADLPMLTRADLQTHFEALKARSPNMALNAIKPMTTSGSSGRPVTVEIHLPSHSPLFSAVSVYDDIWHARDPNQARAILRDVPDGSNPAWNPLYELLGKTGPEHCRNMIDHNPEALFDWLGDTAPAYVRTLPAVVAKLVEVAEKRQVTLPSVQQYLTFAETVTATLRADVKRVLGGRVIDCYSCEEIGWLALQCPRNDHYHVMSATVLIEIVDEAGRPCRVGVPGKVLVTGLHSYAMPLIRYDIGDVAEWGPPCDCGMTLPVIKTLWGRERSFIKLPDGSLKLARVTAEYWRAIAPIDEYRVVQYSDGLLEAFVTMPRSLTQPERNAMQQMLCRVLGHPFETIVTQVPTIDWQHRYKHIDVLRLDYARPQTTK
jgi:phenylacetate-CoA ligase